MKNNKYINNINKKLLSGGVALSLIASSLVGCTKDFNYNKNYGGNGSIVEVTGTMDSKSANKLKVIELQVDDQNLLFLARKCDINTQHNGVRVLTYEYWDVFQDFKIVSVGEKDSNKSEFFSDVRLMNEENLENYLLCYGDKQDEYTIDDLKKVFSKIEENYEFATEKQKVKGK